jgi:23S rRNA-intervening sequence protein
MFTQLVTNLSPMNELPIIQKTYDFVKWYVPILTRLPRTHKFTLGDRMLESLYEFLEGLIVARYAPDKLHNLQNLNAKLDILRYQTRLLVDLDLMKLDRYEYVGKLITEIGNELGGWIKQQKQQKYSKPIRPNLIDIGWAMPTSTL